MTMEKAGTIPCRPYRARHDPDATHRSGFAYACLHGGLPSRRAYGALSIAAVNWELYPQRRFQRHVVGKMDPAVTSS
jgi:hypothetical protein